MSHNWLLLFVIDALSDHVFIVLAADLTENKADFVFEETGLRSIVFFGEEKAECFSGLFVVVVPHEVHDAVFSEKRNILSKKESEITIIFELFCQMVL